MTKQELMETYTAEQLAEMVVDLKNIPTEGKIRCENSGISDLIKVKCGKCGEEFLAFLDEKYILCKKTELFGTQDANKQLNKDVEELQSKVEKYQKAFEGAKNELKDLEIKIKEEYKPLEIEVEALRKNERELSEENAELHCELQAVNVFQEGYSTEPIKVAEMLINASKKRTNCMTGKEYDKYIFEKWQLRQIAEHLLVYCNNQKDDANE